MTGAWEFKKTITYLVKYFGDWALGGTEALAELANLEKRNWLLEEGAGGGPKAATLRLASGAASAPCTS